MVLLQLERLLKPLKQNKNESNLIVILGQMQHRNHYDC